MSAQERKTYLIPRDYHHIRAWGELLKSFPYYIQTQQELAAREQAPVNATFRRDNGTWATADEITRPGVQGYINSKAEEYRKS
jgi:hypothetical protein